VTTLATKARLGFLGLGWIGRARLESVIAAAAADVAAVADPAVPEALDSLDELLAQGVDGVVIATPNALHAPQAVQALTAGAAVFCQKPLGRNTAETRAVVEAARTADRLLGVDLSYRHAEAVQRCRDLVAGGELGDVFAADLVFHNAYGPDKPWFDDPELSGGGCVLDLGTHLVDLVLWALGDPGVEAVHARLLHTGGRAVEDYAVARLDLETGATATIACSWNLPAGRDAVIEAAFYGTRGAVRMHNVRGSFYDLRAERCVGTSAEPIAEPPDDWPGRALCDWAERLAADRRYDDRIEHVIDTAGVLDRIYGRTP
jgi:predicted dehydrogenase